MGFLCVCFCLFLFVLFFGGGGMGYELMLYVSINNSSVMSGCFLGLTSTKQRIKCLAEGH